MHVLLEKIRRNAFFNRILFVLDKIALGDVLLKILYKYYYFFPSEGMKKSQKYFDAREKDIEEIISWLSDEKSKRTYRQMIMFRKTMNYKYHPGCDLPQYFPKDLSDKLLREPESIVFVDGGGYIGDTALEFMENVKGKYKRYVMFEPEKALEKQILANMAEKDNFVLIQKGMWDSVGTLSFLATADSASHIITDETDTETDTIEVCTVDSVSECGDATFIKMDLEGAELHALKGAKGVICNSHPILAICLYHSDEDMIEIPKYIHSLVPEYDFYVRHHSRGVIETVLYAIYKGDK